MKRPPGPEPLARARTLRREQTDAEKRLWQNMRNGRLNGWKFRRQVWIAGYIADFVCMEAKLIVEADGGQHADAHAYDEARSAALAREGFRVLRFWNSHILMETDGVMRVILAALEPTPHPPTASRRAPPSPPGGEGF